MILALALATAALPGSDGITAVAGGRVRSPDKVWTLWASAVDPDAEDSTTMLRLRGPDVRDRGLMPFDREVRVVWPGEPGMVLVVDQGVHLATLHAFTVAKGETVADRLESDMARGLALRRPAIGQVENRRIAFGRVRGTMCVLVEESGLPPGRSEGSYVTRRMAFRLNLAARRAALVRACPGAVLAE
ncbi:hypothetical protein ACG3SL_10015 [Sphingomonas sp. CJ20]